VRRFEPEPPRGTPAGSREAEPLPAEAAVLGLQHSAGNRAVAALLARQPSPAKAAGERGATMTLGLGEDIGVLPLESASWDPSSRSAGRDLHVTCVLSAATQKVQEAASKGTTIPEGFFSTTGGKALLKGILITGTTTSEGNQSGRPNVSFSLTFDSVEFEPVR
jgi:hypothetical protein